MDRDFINALRLLEEKEAKTSLSTGSSELDRLVGNGIEPGAFYLFYGNAESGIDQFLHHLMAEALGAGNRVGRVVYLNCGNYREDKTILDIPSLVNLLKARDLDPRECLERVLVFCAFSEEQQEQVIEEMRQTIEATGEVRLLVVHDVAKLFTAQGIHGGERYRRIPNLQRDVLRLWQMCAERGVALVASCRPSEAGRGVIPRPEGGRYLSHEANVIVYLEVVGGLFPTPQAYLLKHPARPNGRALLNIGGEYGLGMITVPFKVKFERELDSLKGFRDALKDLEKQAAYDEIIRTCTAEQGALANTDIPAVLDAMLLAASVDNRKSINHLSRRVDSLEGSMRRLESKIRVDEDEKG